MSYKISLIKDPIEIDSVYEFVKDQNLDYPNYDLWAKKCYRELKLGYKKAFAIVVNNQKGNPKVVGSLIFQKSKKEPSVLELKNGRVDKEFREKGIFTELLVQVEKYALENNFKKIIGDAHFDMQDMIQIMEKRGYKIEAHENLYSSNKIEVILTKDLSDKSLLISNLESRIIRLNNRIKLFFLKMFRFVLQANQE